MGHIGIITEYNPFHNGHAYQISKIKELYPDKKIIPIMSGDFVQRGEPAIYNKYLRTKCALSSGVDIIFELPVPFATASAEHFASAAITALSSTGVVDTLCFGAEDDCIDDLNTIADLLVSEPSAYRVILKKYLKDGCSFPMARGIAVSSYLKNPAYEELLRKPNNILGIEYLKAIKRLHLNLKPVIIKRTGAGYHDPSLTSSFSSATAIRNELRSNDQMSSLKHHLPAASYELLKQDAYAKPLFADHFYPLLQYALWEHKNDYTNYWEINDDIARQLSALTSYPEDYNNLITLLSSKNMTSSRIRHALLNILLGCTNETFTCLKAANYITYLRLLGFQRTASSILKEMKQTAEIPIINKVADASDLLSDSQLTCFHRDLSASDLYRQVYTCTYHQNMPTEYEHTVIIHDDSHTIE